MLTIFAYKILTSLNIKQNFFKSIYRDIIIQLQVNYYVPKLLITLIRKINYILLDKYFFRNSDDIL